jgi:hypothetical protein
MRGLLGVIVLIVTAAPAFSHHSFAMYDQTTTKTMTGKLTRYVPGANHAQLLFVVVDNDGKVVMKEGKPVQWGVETGSAAAMARLGVSPIRSRRNALHGEALSAARRTELRRTCGHADHVRHCDAKRWMHHRDREETHRRKLQRAIGLAAPTLDPRH